MSRLRVALRGYAELQRAGRLSPSTPFSFHPIKPQYTSTGRGRHPAEQHRADAGLPDGQPGHLDPEAPGNAARRDRRRRLRRLRRHEPAARRFVDQPVADHRGQRAVSGGLPVAGRRRTRPSWRLWRWTAARRYAANPALLAQLVEHFHGKEGVDGSSPSEGLADRLCLRGFGAESVGDRGLWLGHVLARFCVLPCQNRVTSGRAGSRPCGDRSQPAWPGQARSA